ncbi:hypothetical protein [Jeotgalibacillus sp. R-1-5s-1]|uniref:hypothetical protein n=1 Tax=Jeotgalibacillus sp. R-1-5s-1 TaxID=2555897 RepID=UPI0010696995|nr:hypothetical protein [Jeotgalibacillus sp. R-1-5s-1]TFD92827.1 hypothetical protein E2491_14795 [Jeotgalibacillus sp. R-1-5s-1]
MSTVILFGLITIISVAAALKLKKKRLLLTPILAIGVFVLVKIIQVPMPFWDTVTFIFDLRG